MPSVYDAEAEHDFSKARMKAILASIASVMVPGRRRLLGLDEVKSILKIRGEEYRGVIAVPVDMIIGSEGRYKDFAQGFLPKHDYLKARWVRVNSAHYNNIILPPIRLYELGGAYFVRDGNHRVSVAKMQGAIQIDAEVVTLGSKVKIKKDMTLDELKQVIIDYEKKEFYAQTLFGQITDDPTLDFSAPGSYDQIVEHILVHKYYLNERTSQNIDFVMATDSWYKTIYLPIADTIRKERLATRFPGRTISDLYIYIVKYWDTLKKTYGLHYPAADAARDFAARYGRTFSDTIKLAFRKLFGRT